MKQQTVGSRWYKEIMKKNEVVWRMIDDCIKKIL